MDDRLPNLNRNIRAFLSHHSIDQKFTAATVQDQFISCVHQGMVNLYLDYVVHHLRRLKPSYSGQTGPLTRVWNSLKNILPPHKFHNNDNVITNDDTGVANDALFVPRTIHNSKLFDDYSGKIINATLFIYRDDVDENGDILPWTGKLNTDIECDQIKQEIQEHFNAQTLATSVLDIRELHGWMSRYPEPIGFAIDHQFTITLNTVPDYLTPCDPNDQSGNISDNATMHMGLNAINPFKTRRHDTNFDRIGWWNAEPFSFQMALAPSEPGYGLPDTSDLEWESSLSPSPHHGEKILQRNSCLDMGAITNQRVNHLTFFARSFDQFKRRSKIGYHAAQHAVYHDIHRYLSAINQRDNPMYNKENTPPARGRDENSAHISGIIDQLIHQATNIQKSLKKMPTDQYLFLCNLSDTISDPTHRSSRLVTETLLFLSDPEVTTDQKQGLVDDLIDGAGHDEQNRFPEIFSAIPESDGIKNILFNFTSNYLKIMELDVSEMKNLLDRRYLPTMVDRRSGMILLDQNISDQHANQLSRLLENHNTKLLHGPDTTDSLPGPNKSHNGSTPHIS